jgi:hypothetical protein
MDMNKTKLGNFRTVSNMRSNKGTIISNQFIVETDTETIFQSYATIICIRTHEGKIILDESAWNYSKTTGKYRNIMLGENTEATRKKIKAGEYVLANLNN